MSVRSPSVSPPGAAVRKRSLKVRAVNAARSFGGFLLVAGLPFAGLCLANYIAIGWVN